jgi:hypothetical protein
VDTRLRSSREKASSWAQPDDQTCFLREGDRKIMCAVHSAVWSSSGDNWDGSHLDFILRFLPILAPTPLFCLSRCGRRRRSATLCDGTDTVSWQLVALELV